MWPSLNIKWFWEYCLWVLINESPYFTTVFIWPLCPQPCTISNGTAALERVQFLWISDWMLVSIFVTALVSVVKSSLSSSSLTIKLSPTHQIEKDTLKGDLCSMIFLWFSHVHMFIGQQKQIEKVFANPGTDLILGNKVHVWSVQTFCC